MSLVWEQFENFFGPTFDLVLKNPEDVNVTILKELLYKVEAYDPYVKQDFDAIASRLFREWLDSPNQPLAEHAYASLSNWFMSDGPRYKDTGRAFAAERLWEALFCVKPSRRLTIPGSKKIIPERFKDWWPQQVKNQQ